MLLSELTGTDGQVDYQLSTVGGFVYGLSCSTPEAHRVAVAVGDKTIRIWDLLSEDAEAYQVYIIYMYIL